MLHVNPASAEEFARACDRTIALASALRSELEGDSGPARLATTFREFDTLLNVVDSSGWEATMVSRTNPTAEIRQAGRDCMRRIDAFRTSISLSKPLYQRLRAIDASLTGTLPDPNSRFLLTRAMQQFERAGIALDDATLDRVTALQDRINRNSLEFQRGFAESRNQVMATVDDLKGLPADFIAAHPPDPQGRIIITTDIPDLRPVMSYAESDDLRRRLMIANGTRAYPANDELLRQILNDRAELAKLLGQPNFASLVLEGKMIGSPANVERFLYDINRMATPPSDRDQQLMLERLRRTDPSAVNIPAWSADYLQQQVRKDRFDVDPQEVRQYFAYDNVRDGILRLAEDLFRVRIRRWSTAVWAPDVEAYEVLDGGEVIARFYMDNHPRPGKYTHATVQPLRVGVTGRSIPIGLLISNLPAGNHSTGLMEHREVLTFLHEFGHLLHLIFSGRQGWAQANYLNVEWDFIEAPSQMLENWIWDYETLRRFAVNAKGQPIPRSLVERMNRARGFAEAFGDRRLLALSNVSLAYHLKAPGADDLTQIYRTAFDAFSPIPLADGMHPQASLPHLTSYSALFYTYLWSKVISTDLFTVFQRNGLRDPATARRYREIVLAPGSAVPALRLIEEFLGRPLSMNGYRANLVAGGHPVSAKKCPTRRSSRRQAVAVFSRGGDRATTSPAGWP